MKRNLLFVDDEIGLLNSFKRERGHFNLNWNILYASSGSEALKIMEAVYIDAVISESRMPFMDGYEFPPQVQAHRPSTVHMPEERWQRPGLTNLFQHRMRTARYAEILAAQSTSLAAQSINLSTQSTNLYAQQYSLFGGLAAESVCACRRVEVGCGLNGYRRSMVARKKQGTLINLEV